MEKTNSVEIGHLQQDIADIKVSLKSVSESLQRLSRLEERFTTVADSISRIEHHYENLDERVRKLENEYIYAKASAKTIAVTAKVAWALAGGLIMTVLSKLLHLVA